MWSEAQAEAQRRDWEQRSADMARFSASLDIPGVVVPPSLLTLFVPPPLPHPIAPTGTPVSVYGRLLF